MKGVELSYVFIMGVFAMTILALVASTWVAYQYGRSKAKLLEDELTKKHENELLEAVLKYQELERRKLAADIHDSLSSILWAVKMNISFVYDKARLSGEFRQPLEESTKLVGDALDTSRRISKNITPDTIEVIGLTAAIRELCGRFAKSGIRIQFREYGVIQEICGDRKIYVYRVIQELLNNYIKHSTARIISIEVYGGRYLTICLVDNGKPFELKITEENQTGLGLLSIQNRLKHLNATLRSEAGPPNKIQLVIPTS